MTCPRTGRWLGATAGLLLLPLSLAAQPPEKKAPTRNPEVVELSLTGVKAVKPKELLASIATDKSHCVSAILTPICWISKAKWAYARKYLDRDELERDVLRTRVFYWKRGYRDTEVDTLVAPKGDDKVGVTFFVTEGPPTMVSDVTVTQKQEILTTREVARSLVLGENSPLNMLRLDTSVVFLQQRLWDKGYADAVVDTTVQVDTVAMTATVEIDIDPRWKATVSDIIVEGNEKISTRTILRSLTLHAGNLFKRSELLRSQRALYESNLFRRAAIEIPRQDDSSKVLVVTVLEAPLRETRISTGFSTVDFFQVEGRYTNYNFFRGARRADISGAVGNLFANALNGRFIFRDAFRGVQADRSAYFKPTYNVSLNFRQPWFLANNNELALSLFAHRRSAPGIYVDRGLGTSATFTRELLERASTSLSYRFEVNRVDAGDVYFCVNFGVCDRSTLDALRDRQRLSPLALTGLIDRANDPFAPNSGYRASADIEHASALTISSFRYNRASMDGAAYFKVRKRGALAGHLRLGWVKALSSTREAVGLDDGIDILHPRKRFYAGGSRSVRGFGENQLGPRVLTIPASKLRDSTCAADIVITDCDPNAAGLSDRDFEARPLGGNLVAESSVEFRFPVWRALIGAVFVDAGYVAQRVNPALPRSKTAVTPGFGARYRSPVGPIRVDFGINPGRSETLTVVTEGTVNGQTRLVTLAERRRFNPFRSGSRGVLDRMTLHLSIGEAF